MQQRSSSRKASAARFSIFSNTVLTLAKLGVGLWTGSVAILSEAVHSATDLIAAMIAFFAVRASEVPPDAEHPYGHGKMESLSGVVEAMLIIAAGVYIVIESVQELRHHEPTQALGWGIAVMLLSAIANFLISRYLFKVAHETDSIALEADAHHLQIDVWTSLGVLVGLVLVRITGINWIDPVVALIVSVFILRTGGTILMQATRPLLDERLPDEEIRRVEGIMTQNPEVLGWHKLRTRKAGSHRHIDVHIQVDDDLTLREAHRLTENLEDEIRDALPNVHVVIHTEPYEEERRHHEENPH
ncbi:MAG: cation diffusion facilitator family transporter [Armatimonadaceae bacterium]